MFRPCIDLHNGRVKQIVGGTLSGNGQGIVENFVSDKEADYYAKRFKEDGLKGGHVIMLGKGNEKAALEALTAYPEGLQVGGGINPSNAQHYIEKGASHIIVTSYIFHNGQLDFKRLEEMVAAVSKERLVLDLSCRTKDNEYYVVTDRWQTFTNFQVNHGNIQQLEDYCDEFLIHGVDVEGKQQGIDLQLVESISKWASIPVTYAGGIRSFDDIKTINKVGQGKVHYTVGSALDIFGGKLSYEEVVKNQLII